MVLAKCHTDVWAGDPPACPEKRQLTIVNFHLQVLCKALESVPDLPDMEDAIQFLQSSMKTVDVGANKSLLAFHLKRLKAMVPDNKKVQEAVEWLSIVVEFRHSI